MPFYALMPEVAQALANTWFDTAATPYLYRPEVFRRVADAVGSDRVLFGSDYPLMRPERVIKQVEGADLAPAEREAMLGRNAAGLLGLPVG